MDEQEKEKLREKMREFWQGFFDRRHWPHQELARRLHVGNDTVSHWVHAINSMRPEHLSKLLKSNILSDKEASRLIKLSLLSLGFSEGCLPSIAAAIGGMPASNNKFTTYTNLWATDFPRLVAAAQDRIDILQTYIPNIEAMDDVLPIALENGCTIRILVLKLDSDYLQARLNHLGSDKSAMTHSLNRLKNVAQASKSLRGSIEIKAYNFLCYFPYHRIDNRVFIGFYLREGSSKYPQIGMRVDELTLVLPDLLQHFEEYWDRQDNELLASNRDPKQ